MDIYGHTIKVLWQIQIGHANTGVILIQISVIICNQDGYQNIKFAIFVEMILIMQFYIALQHKPIIVNASQAIF
jgi:hypothetical protein